MRTRKVLLLILMSITIISACGNNDSKNNDATNTAKQQEVEIENEKLKAEAEKLKKELAEKEEKEAIAQKKTEEKASAKENSQETYAANAMSLIVPHLAENTTIDEKTYNYLVDHYELFPAVTSESKSAAKAEVDASITTRHLLKNIKPYLDKMVTVSGFVEEIEEEETEIGTIASIHIIDDNDNSVVGVFMDSTGDILDGDNVTMTGVPTMVYSFDNVSGGTTVAILFTVSTIQKSQ